MDENPQEKNGIAGGPLSPQVKANGTAYETFQAANQAPEATPKHDINESIQLLHKEEPIAHLRTFQSDIAEAVKEKDASIISIAAAEKARAGRTPSSTINTSLTNTLMLGISLLLILVSAGFFVFFYFSLKNTRTQNIPPPAIQSNKIIITEAEKQFPLPGDNNSLNALIAARGSATGNPGSITEIQFTKSIMSNGKASIQTIDAQTFFTDLNTKVPTWFIRSLTDPYLIGYYNDQGNTQPLMIFKISSYENAFAGMLKWEDTLASDFSSFYSLPGPVPQTPAIIASTTEATASTTKATTTSPKSTTKKSGIASSTSKTTIVSTTTVITQPVTGTGQIHFEDSIINNKTVRVLVSETGKALLFYSFPDKNTLIITSTIETLKEVLARMVTSQFVQ